MTTDFLFSENDILSFRLFCKPLLQVERGQYLKENLISTRGNRFLGFFFSDTDSNKSSFSVQ